MQLMASKYKTSDWIIGLTIGLLSIPMSFAQPPKDELAVAQQWLAEGNYPQAFEVFHSYAQDKQNHLAQFTLALFYQQGWGMEKDEALACRWHGEAAKGGIPAASHFFAQCLQEGIHRPVDYKAAIHWYQQAADLGHTLSLCAIGELAMQGKGMEKDPQKALEYCERAAAAGSVPAQLQMGGFYLEGDQSIRDPQKAAIWFGYAAEKGSLQASHYLGVINRDFFRDTDRALYWFETAASQGYIPAYYPTAKLYFTAPVSNETGMPEAANLAKSYLWLSATQRQSHHENELQAAANMLEKVLQVMPAGWQTDLDQKVTQHLQKYQ
ncbi:hypothetical protein SAMN05421754_100566 [Nitrosomonas sp. Nm58]|nr:hypothetical protein SAMN05421754_100566 [Nitrosomonas sp. Nm58]